MNFDGFSAGGQQNQNELGDDAQVNQQAPEQFNNFLNADAEKRKLIQQQLILLLHGHKCLRREQQQRLDGTEPVYECTLPHCATMKQVLIHMANCSDGKHCLVPNCSSSRQIINHWKNCPQTDCPVCLPLKQAYDRKASQGDQTPLPNAQIPQQIMKKAYQALGLPYNELNYLQQNPQTTNILNVNSQTQTQSPKAWQSEVNSDLRQHLVQKIVQAIFPSDYLIVLPQDLRLSNLFKYAAKVECEMFEKAISREEYNHLLAEKIYKIQQEHEEKRMRRREMQLQQQNQSAPVQLLVNPNLSQFNSNLANSTNLQSNSPMLGGIVALQNVFLSPQKLEEAEISNLLAQL